MRADPVRQGLRPGRLGVGEVRRPQHGDEDFRHAHLAGDRVGDRHLLAGIVDERLVPGDVGLAHGRRQAALEFPVQLTKAAVPVAMGMNGAIFLPQNQQRDARPLHLAHQRRPVGFGIPAPARLAARRGKQQLFERLVGQIRRQRPAKPGRGCSGQVILHGAAADADLPGDDPSPRVRPKMQMQNLSYPPHGQSLPRHPATPSIAMADWMTGER